MSELAIKADLKGYVELLRVGTHRTEDGGHATSFAVRLGDNDPLTMAAAVLSDLAEFYARHVAAFQKADVEDVRCELQRRVEEIRPVSARAYRKAVMEIERR